LLKYFVLVLSILNIFMNRDMLRNNYNTRQFWIEISIEDVLNYDEDLADQILRRPGEFINIVRNQFNEYDMVFGDK
jgi:DNA replicative helicase MCM subunit Mcm2 (Cdc46/Mcm family)